MPQLQNKGSGKCFEIKYSINCPSGKTCPFNLYCSPKDNKAYKCVCVFLCDMAKSIRMMLDELNDDVKFYKCFTSFQNRKPMYNKYE